MQRGLVIATIVVGLLSTATGGWAAPACGAAPAGHDHGATAAASAADPRTTDREIARLTAALDTSTGEAKVAVMADLLKQLLARTDHAPAAVRNEQAPPALGGCPKCDAMKTPSKDADHAHEGHPPADAPSPRTCPMMAGK